MELCVRYASGSSLISIIESIVQVLRKIFVHFHPFLDFQRNNNNVSDNVVPVKDKEHASKSRGNPQSWGMWWCWIQECGLVNYMPQDWCSHCGHSKHAKQGNVHLNNLKRKLAKISGGAADQLHLTSFSHTLAHINITHISHYHYQSLTCHTNIYIKSHRVNQYNV